MKSARGSASLVLLHNSPEMFSFHSFLNGHVGAELVVVDNSEVALFQQLQDQAATTKNSLIRIL